MSRTRHLLVAILVVGLGFVGIGARCIENVAVRTDDDGYTYLLGEIFNDTDVHGTEIVLRAMLYDASGGTIASKNIDLMCPGDLAPHSQSAYAVKFDQKDLPPYASFDVRPIAGKTLTQPHAEAPVTIVESGASWLDDDRVQVRFSVRNDGPNALAGLSLCSTTYDAQGKVRQMSPVDPADDHADVILDPGQTLDLGFTLWGQGGAASARAWLTFGGSYQSVMTESLPITP